MLSVSDTGTGMTDEVKAHMFEAFFTTKPKGKGTGLGLATCQTIVQQSGGHIGVYSEVGKGTTFKVYFPRVEQPLDVAARPIQTGPLPRGTETLLVVEDEPSVRHLACDVLEAQGYEVLWAANGQDALHVAREHKGAPIRLVITDVIMPLMGGKVMAEWLKASLSRSQNPLHLGIHGRRHHTPRSAGGGSCVPAQTLHARNPRPQSAGNAGCRAGNSAFMKQPGMASSHNLRPAFREAAPGSDSAERERKS